VLYKDGCHLLENAILSLVARACRVVQERIFPGFLVLVILPDSIVY
jgi:hypothetical protein